MSQKIAQRRVEKSAALLDKTFPGWANEIKLDQLQLYSCGDCICGQLGKRLTLDALGLERRSTSFNVNAKAIITKMLNKPRVTWYRLTETLGFDSSEMVTYAELDAEWKAAITARVAA